jgi:hypothetical protein
MRLVGSMNVKPHRTPTCCELIQLHPDRRYTLKDFDQYAVLPRKISVLHRPRGCHTRGELNPRVVEALADLFLAQGFKVRGTWLNGSCVYPEHHKHGDAHPSFGYNTATGLGYCHICGTMLTKEICRATHIDPANLGGLMRTT